MRVDYNDREQTTERGASGPNDVPLAAVALSGDGNYSCSDAFGNPGTSHGNISVSAYAEDNATSGAAQDRFWVSNGATVSTNYLKMTGPAGTNALYLTGGNVQVPQPQGK